MVKKKSKTKIVTIRKFNWECVYLYPFIVFIGLGTCIAIFVCSFIPVFNVGLLTKIFDIFGDKNSKTSIIDELFKNVKYKVIETVKITKMVKVK